MIIGYFQVFITITYIGFFRNYTIKHGSIISKATYMHTKSCLTTKHVTNPLLTFVHGLGFPLASREHLNI